VFNFLKIVVALALVVGIVGGSAYFAYDLFWEKPEPVIEASAEPTPPPRDPAMVALEAAMTQLSQGNEAEAREGLESILVMATASSAASQARETLGQLNAAALFSPEPGPGKTPYVVAKGDAISRIATRAKISPDLLVFINNLPTINLQIGQTLQLPALNISGAIDPGARLLTLLNDGRFFKSYPLVEIPSPLPAGPAQVTDRVAMADGKRVAFGDKPYQASEKTILLNAGGLVIRAEGAGSQRGFVLSPADLAEVYLLVRPGTEFTMGGQE
jgi:LysM repeat protein